MSRWEIGGTVMSRSLVTRFWLPRLETGTPIPAAPPIQRGSKRRALNPFQRSVEHRSSDTSVLHMRFVFSFTHSLTISVITNTGDVRADQRLVADHLEREAQQDRRERRQPRPLCRLPDGRGRHPQYSVRLGAAAATGGRIGMKRSIVLRSIKNQGRGASG